MNELKQMSFVLKTSYEQLLAAPEYSFCVDAPSLI